MSDLQQKFTGREYTLTVAWLAFAILFIPAAVVTLRPSYLALLLAVASSAVCLAGAWLTWKNSSRLSIPTIANAPEPARVPPQHMLDLPLILKDGKHEEPTNSSRGAL